MTTIMDQSDIALPDLTETQHIGANSVEHSHENGDQGNQNQRAATRMVAATTESGTVVSVPMPLPLIGATFNVITPDQLPHFKQILCGNGFISNVVNDVGELKPTHIVIQQQQQQQQQQPQESAIVEHHQQQNQPQPDQQHANQSDQKIAPTQPQSSHLQQQQHNQQQQLATQTISTNWNDTMNMEVLSIRCKTTTAELFKSRLGSGGRGKCIKYKDQWFTPSEFENLCGRGSSKDWKRSIRYGGRSLQALIDESIITPHATSCTCAACCDDDATASGPVRLFTPYKRRRRNQPDPIPCNVPTKPKKPCDDEILHEAPQGIVTKEENTWQSITEDVDSASEYIDSSSQIIVESNVSLDRLKTICAQMTKATNEFRRCLLEVKEVHARQVERLQRERDAALMAARVHADVDDSNNMHHIPGVELQTTKKCANCNREAMAECSLCRRTPYCSTFCQRKDWNSHQVECTRDPNEGTQQIMLLVDEQA